MDSIEVQTCCLSSGDYESACVIGLGLYGEGPWDSFIVLLTATVPLIVVNEQKTDVIYFLGLLVVRNTGQVQMMKHCL